jgi:hypothetical protein
MLSVSQSKVSQVPITSALGGLLVGRSDKRIAWKFLPASLLQTVNLSTIIIPLYLYAQWDLAFTGKPAATTARLAFASEVGMDYMKHGDACQRELWYYNSALSDDGGTDITTGLMLIEAQLPCPVHQYIQNGWKL